ncbi:MAG: DNA-3-methyladenine glycosylase I [Gammaproteobacteria bacterium]|nr:DNA-3-methyladenine glycosylase I [Gammaproteobacteria bacterium]
MDSGSKGKLASAGAVATGAAESRCDWCGTEPLLIRYHDEEWGVPERAEQPLFERLILEGMQAGLSWLTVLRKRNHMREAFLGFDIEALAAADDHHMEEWLRDPGLIRNRAKLASVVINAQATLALPNSLSEQVWSFVDGEPTQNRWCRQGEVPSQTDASVAMSNSLKNLGFRFVGPVICYAFMQSAGLVNDHLVDCPAHSKCAALS